MPAGPDFLCIGMMKAGSAWLFDQLQFHPDFWMPPIKELHYLDYGAGRVTKAGEVLRVAREAPNRLKRFRQASRRQWDERELQFLEEMASHNEEEPDIDRYASLFRHKGNLKSGDVTPHYCTLSRRVITGLNEHFPELRGVLLLRDPVARAWSHIAMKYHFEKGDDSHLDDPSALRSFLENSKMIRRYSFASKSFRRWTSRAPRIQIRHFFLDDIASRPDEVRREVLTFLGADPDKPSGVIDPGHNRKSTGLKLTLTEDLQAVLVEHFAQELRDCAALFGGAATNWVAKYGA